MATNIPHPPPAPDEELNPIVDIQEVPAPPPNRIMKEGTEGTIVGKKPLLCRWGIHWFGKKIRRFTIMYTECRCGKRSYCDMGSGFTALNTGWLNGLVDDIHDWSWMSPPTVPLYTPTSMQRVRIPDYTLEGCRAYANSPHPNPEAQKRMYWLLDEIQTLTDRLYNEKM